MLKRLSIILLFTVLPAMAVAQTVVGYDFLRTTVGARPSAMGGAFVAVPGDIHNVAYNPAGIASLVERSGTFSYLNHLLDFQSGFLAYAQPFSGGTAAASLNFIDFGSFDGRDEQDNSTGEFGANGLVLAATYGRPVMKNLTLGGSAKYIRFQIDNFTQSAVALDAGAIYSISSRGFNIGATVFNLGTTTSAFIETEDELPLNVQLGFSKVLQHLPVMISAAVVKFKDDDIDFRFGGEIRLTEQLAARLGYNSVGQDQKVDTSRDKFAGVSIGLGFKINRFDVDYSFSSFGEVGALNRFTLVGRL